MKYLLPLFHLLDDYRYLYAVSCSQHARGRYLFWITSTLVQCDRLVTRDATDATV